VRAGNDAAVNRFVSRKTQLPQARTHRASLRNKSPNGRGLSLRASSSGLSAVTSRSCQCTGRPPRGRDQQTCRDCALHSRSACYGDRRTNNPVCEAPLLVVAYNGVESGHRPFNRRMSLNRVRTSQRAVLGYLPVRQIWSRCCHRRKSPRNPRLYAIWNVQLSMRSGVVGPEKVKVFVESKNRR
jgi:hypothetical protein